MSTQLWVEQPVRVPAPGDLSAYLLQRGWTLEGKPDRWAQHWRRASDGAMQTVEVPQRSEAGDYPRVVRMLRLITRMTAPCIFVDETVAGAFAEFQHTHEFEELGGGMTLMRDLLRFAHR